MTSMASRFFQSLLPSEYYHGQLTINHGRRTPRQRPVQTGRTAAGAAAGALLVQPARAERLKDLASIAGVRQNQLMGYGLVVGLDGSGDQTTQTPFTVQSVVSMLQQLGSTCRRAPRCN
jgi:hypothetical protein